MKNTKEIDKCLKELNKAISDYQKIMNDLLRLSIFGKVDNLEVLISEVDSHNKCDFGKWLNKRFKEYSFDNEAFVKLFSSHKDFHKEMAIIANLINNKEKVTPEQFDKYDIAMNRFIYDINTLKVYLLSYRNMHDNLTGLPLRNFLFEDFSKKQQINLSNDLKLYLFIMDIDRFKKLNDTYGHNFGDLVLQYLAKFMTKIIRNNEKVYRFGGEEFVFMSDLNNDKEAIQMAKRICKDIENEKIKINDIEINITVTCGITKVIEREDLRVSLERADKALYYGKNTGRNKSVFSDESGNMLEEKDL